MSWDLDQSVRLQVVWFAWHLAGRLRFFDTPSMLYVPSWLAAVLHVGRLSAGSAKFEVGLWTSCITNTPLHTDPLQTNPLQTKSLKTCHHQRTFTTTHHEHSTQRLFRSWFVVLVTSRIHTHWHEWLLSSVYVQVLKRLLLRVYAPVNIQEQISKTNWRFKLQRCSMHSSKMPYWSSTVGQIMDAECKRDANRYVLYAILCWEISRQVVYRICSPKSN